jgi:hypothetical protein
VRTKEYVATPHFPAGFCRVRTKPPARVPESCRSRAAICWRPRPRDSTKARAPPCGSILSVAAPPIGSSKRWDNLKNTPWNSMEQLARVGQDKLLMFLLSGSPPLGTTHYLRPQKIK